MAKSIVVGGRRLYKSRTFLNQPLAGEWANRMRSWGKRAVVRKETETEWGLTYTVWVVYETKPGKKRRGD